MIHASETAPEIFRYLEQAYVSFKPPKAKGFQVDFGEFVTSAGAEVIETKDNWNYSRSLLFAWAIPYYHFGVRTSMPIGPHFTAGVQLVNGWNNIEDNNAGKTVGLTAAATSKKVSWNVNYYAGPERATPLKGTRQLIDTTVMLTPTGNASFYINYDYGKEHRNEIKDSVTGEFKAKEGILMRLEYRRDWANANLFERGNNPFSSKNQTTLVAGFVAFFGPKR
jgi:hypothetical protein